MISPPPSLTMRLTIFWVIYDHPADHPHGYVVRPQFVCDSTIRASEASWLCATPEEARECVPRGLTRFEDENPRILEVWA